MSSEKRNKPLKWVSLGLIFGMSQFILLTILAMIFYAGGSQYDPTASSYDFLQNFFSDLGMRTAWSGSSNTVASALFTIALAVSGASVLPFVLLFPTTFSRRSISFKFSIVTLITGIPTSIGFIVIAFAPWDLYLSVHMIAVYVAFVGAVPVMFGLTGAFWIAKKFPRYLVWAGAVVTFIVLLYVWLLFWGPSGSETARLIQVVGQKIVAYAIILGFLTEGWGMWHNFNDHQEK